MRHLSTLLVLLALPALVLPSVALAEPKVGDQAQNVKVIPPWTMRTCPKEFYATYDTDGALQLKKTDNDCWLWKQKQELLTTQSTAQAKKILLLEQKDRLHEERNKNSEQRISELLKQLNKEIEEKNTYKYKPNYGWLYISIGAALAVAGVCFGVGVWVAKKD